MTAQSTCLQFLLQFILSYNFLLELSLSQPVDFPQIYNIRIPTSGDKLKQRSTTNLICNINQYFDDEEGRCSGVPGGGRAIQIDRSRSCRQSNTLNAHCKYPRYYYICKENKIILAECADGTHFDSRFRRCVFVDPASFDSRIISPEDMPYQQRINLPECRKPGRFPLENNCALFYVCQTNGHRLHQNAFKCPNGTGFDIEKKLCLPQPDCTDDNNISGTLCLVNTKDENIQAKQAPETYMEDSFSIADNSSQEYLTEETTPSSVYYLPESTTVFTSVQDVTEANPIQPIIETSASTKDQIPTVNPTTESLNHDWMTTESVTLGTSTQYTSALIAEDERPTNFDDSNQNTDKINTRTVTPLPLWTEDPISSSTPIESVKSAEVNRNQTDMSLTTSVYDERSSLSLSTMTPIDEFTFGPELVKEESSTPSLVSEPGTTNSPITE